MAESTASSHNHHHESASHAPPVVRLLAWVEAEKNDLTVLIVYTVVAGILGLIVPLTMQALVNIIAANVLLQPLVVMSLLVLVGLLVSGFLQISKMRLVEIVQQRVFARTALAMANRLARVHTASLRGEYGPELVNRFFDTLTVQKALSKLLFDGLAALLQAGIGLVLLAFYNPLLFGFDVVLVLSIAAIFGLLGWGGLRTSIKESKEKYHVADWLQEIARCHAGFKLHSSLPFLLSRVDELVMRYIDARDKHFRVLARLSGGYYIFQACATAGILGIGGWLVIQRELTLGQLVAAQIVVISLLAALEKLIRQAEQIFDLLTGMDKIGHVLELHTERSGGALVPLDAAPNTVGASLTIRDLRFGYHQSNQILNGFDLTVAPGEKICVVGESGAGKTTLTSLLCGLEEPQAGIIAIDGRDIREWELSDLRRHVSRVGNEREIFDGTVIDNVSGGRSYVSATDVMWAMEVSQMSEELARLPFGSQTVLVSAGQNISHGQAQRILIARGIAGRPRLLILDEAFNGIGEATARRIRDSLFHPSTPWTILAISHNVETIAQCTRVVVLQEGVIVEQGSPTELAKRTNSVFCQLFPSLGVTLRHPEETKGYTSTTNLSGKEATA